MKRRCTTYAVVLQVVAILLLQWYSIAPHLVRKVVQLACSGDHQLCGCAPEMIAAHTCCCDLRKLACCSKEKTHQGEDQFAKREGNPSTLYFSIAPCRSSAEFDTVSLDKLKFVPAGTWPVISSSRSPEFSSTFGETANSRPAEPPDPPPRPLAFS